MTEEELNKLRYPVGKYAAPPSAKAEEIKDWIDVIEALPAKLRKTVEAMTEAELDTVYRPGGWTRRQVVHHLADSHMNCYIRCKLAVTQDNPTINPYKESVWAEMNDGKNFPVAVSLDLLEAVHLRLVDFLRRLSTEEWQRTYYHPESKKTWKLYEVAALYAWHSRHHAGHVGLVNAEL